MSEKDPFVAHRSLLFTVAYELLGSAADAEDVVQETWLRWADVDHEEVRDPRAYLVRIVTRQALNRLRTLARRKEDYVGEWLPEPLLTSPDVAEDVELAESVSIAMLTVLESLTPTERAVFVLREVFDVPHEEIPRRSASRRRPCDRSRTVHGSTSKRVDLACRSTQSEQQEVVDRFVKAVMTGDLQGLLDVLAPDVVLVADGGGIAPAILKPLSGIRPIANLLSKFTRLCRDAQVENVWVNGGPAARIDGGEKGGETVISVAIEDGRITHIFAMRNPHKLARIDAAVELRR